MGEVIHCFEETNGRTKSVRHLVLWDEIYRKYFPDMIFSYPNLRKNDAQFLGIDRVIVLRSTRIIRIDEKVREKTYPDILLEYVSNDRKNSPGWMNTDPFIDYIAYAFIDTQTCYFLSWDMLKRTWVRYFDEWLEKAKENKEGFKHVIAKNKFFNTLSIAVPLTLLLKKNERR